MQLCSFHCHFDSHHIAEKPASQPFDQFLATIMQSGDRENIGTSSIPPSSACSSSRTAASANMTSPLCTRKTAASSHSQKPLCGVVAASTCNAPPAAPEKGTVRFNPSIRIRPIPSLSFLSDEEKRNIWYYEDEISGFKETIRLDVRHMRQQMRQTELAPEHINDTPDRCSRGIEHFATRDALVRQETAKSALIESVLREQAHLSAKMQSLDSHDAKHKNVRADAIAQALCDVSTRMSLEARSRAATLGASDRAFVAAEEAGLRALLASCGLASHTAQTDTSLAARGYMYAHSVASIQPTTTAGRSAAGSLSSSSCCLKRSACSVPDMTNYAGSASTSSAPNMVQAYEQFATHRRRRLSLLRDSLLTSMTISDTSTTQQHYR